MYTTVSEPNTILEINDAHADNFVIVLPRLPSARFMSSVFNDFTKKTGILATPGSSGTSGTSGTPDAPDCRNVCETQLQREQNLDLVNFKLYISGMTLPTVDIDTYKVDTQFHALSRAGKLRTGNLTTSMMISENFLNYNAILYWMYMIHNPENRNVTTGRELIDEVFTDMYIIITNNTREKVAEYKLLDAFPISLDSVPFTYKTADKLSINVGWAHSGMYASNNFVLKYV